LIHWEEFENILRKLFFGDEQKTIDWSNLSDFVGKPVMVQDKKLLVVDKEATRKFFGHFPLASADTYVMDSKEFRKGFKIEMVLDIIRNFW
jgi:hypothetical protein